MLDLRRRHAPGGRFDYDRRLWILLPEEAQAITGATIRALGRCLDEFPAIPRAHTGKRGAMRVRARELRALLAALQRDKRCWSPALIEAFHALVPDLREHDALADPAVRLWSVDDPG